MAKYLISFPSAAMVVPDDDWEAVVHDSHALIEEAKAAGVYVSPERIQMPRVRVESFTISLDGYGAGPDQDLANPLGAGATDLHHWLLPTRTLQRALFGNEGGKTGVDEDFASRGFRNVGAWILGRNMFGPIRGPWPDLNWRGWWGDSPPYHVPVFVLTHHARPPLAMEGNTTFHFVTGGIREALDRAREAAGESDVRIGGGAIVGSTVAQAERGCASDIGVHRSSRKVPASPSPV